MNRYSLRLTCLLAGLVGLFVISGCATAPATDTGKASLEDQAAMALSKAKTNDPTFTKILDTAYGYAVFPTVGKGGLGVGGAYGKGVLFERGTAVGYCDLSQASFGLQAGGQSYTEMIAFETKGSAEKFKNGNFTFDAQATAVALKSGAGANAKYRDGVAVFTMDEAGLMAEAAIGGQKFSYQAK